MGRRWQFSTYEVMKSAISAKRDWVALSIFRFLLFRSREIGGWTIDQHLALDCANVASHSCFSPSVIFFCFALAFYYCKNRVTFGHLTKEK